MAERARLGQRISLADIRSVSGFCVSLSLAVPPIMLWVRDLNAMAPLGNLASSRLLTVDEIGTLLEVPEILTAHNGSPILDQHCVVDDSVNLDAGETGGGAVRDGDTHLLDFALPTELVGTSSTRRELIVALKILQKSGSLWTNQTVVFNFDSDNAVKNVLRFGSNKPDLNFLVKQIWELTEHFHINLKPRWVPREENAAADTLSKIWSRTFTLLPQALTTARTLGVKAPIVAPKFTLIGNTLTSLIPRGQS